MSGQGDFPPPGQEPVPPQSAAQPGPWQPGPWQTASYPPPPAGRRPPTHSPLAAHKPGALPLRPLGIGDMYDAAFKIIRHNPRATVGSAVLVAAVAMAIPVLVTGAVSLAVDLSLDPSTSGSGEPTTEEIVGLLGAGGSLLVGALLQSIGLILVTGMIARVCAAAAIGKQLGLVEAWQETRGRRWRLIGLTCLLGLMLTALLAGYAGAWVVAALLSDGALPLVLFGLVSIPLFLACLAWFWVRLYYLPVPALMLEDVGVTGAIRRGYALTRRQFWRTFGIALLTVVVAQVAGSMLSLPVSFLGQGALLAGAPSEWGLFLLVLSQAAGSVVAAAFVSPFTATVTSLQYLDQRIRKEAYDVELMTRAGIRVP